VALLEGRHADPFAVLGPHESGGVPVVRAFVPGADTVDVVTRGGDKELEEKVAVLRNMQTKEQIPVPFATLVKTVRQLTKRH
jgi:hypothetical protein